MSIVPQATPQQSGTPAPSRVNTVVMGRQDAFSTVLRLIGMELYKIRRRAMSKVLSIVSLSIIVFSFFILSLAAIFILSSPVRSFLPPQCSSKLSPGQQCLDRTPTQVELEQAEQTKQQEVRAASSVLRPPLSLVIAIDITRFVGLVLLIILAGTIVGGEYGVGTIRLMFTRGPTRTQFLLSKIGTILVCVVFGFLIMMLAGMIVSTLLNLITGITPEMSNEALIHTPVFLLVAIFNLFIYTMLALFLATLGRSTAAGVAGTFVWIAVEFVLNVACNLIATFNRGFIGDFFKAIPDYFMSTNMNALADNQSHYIIESASSPLSDVHALLVLAVYLILFIGLSWLLIERRDITN